MAPALIGNHREGPCPRCGYPVRVGAPTSGGTISEQFDAVLCPNCLKIFSLAEARDLNGDRLLVDKNVFNLRRPRRWEMAVFFCPDPDPKEFRKPYVKRVIGLPGETISILEGDVFANGELLRKGYAEMREARVPVFSMAHFPDPDGWNIRWLVEPTERDPRLPDTTIREASPAESTVVRRGHLILDAGESPQTVITATYRNWVFEDRSDAAIRVWNSYDGIRSIGRPPLTRRSFEKLPTANDFSLECEVEVVEASSEGCFACRLLDGADAVHVEIPVGRRPNALVVLNHDGKGAQLTVPGVSLPVGRTSRVEFSFVDRRVILAVDGRVIGTPIDLPFAAKRAEVRRPLQVGARGCRLVLRELKLFRDVYYTQFGENGTQPPHGSPVTLAQGEYFVLGDNSGNSQDSRKWPEPGVPEDEFIGKPFLIHQPLRAARWNIRGREREFQTMDWSRVRWLH
jgi:signal peptidase I